MSRMQGTPEDFKFIDDEQAPDAETLVQALINIQEQAESPEQAKEAMARLIGAETKSLDLPPIRQQFNYDCGSACVMSVCKYFGVGPQTEQDYIKALGTNEKDGTNPNDICNYLETLGLKVDARNDLTIQDLIDAVAKGSPVICPIQDYENSHAEIPQMESGHYVVIQDADTDNVTFMDPSAGKVSMLVEEFLARWEDKADEVYTHFGIIVSRPVQKALTPETLALSLKRFFIKQGQELAEKIASEIETKSDSSFFDIDEWTNKMATWVKPVMKMYYDYAAKSAIKQFGLTPNMFAVIQPSLREGLQKSLLLFCKETNETTSMELGKAIEELRNQLREGLISGDTKTAMLLRVKSIFENASDMRAWRIASTESSRGIHNSQIIVAKESGLKLKKQWLLSSEACPTCQQFKDKSVNLDENFGVIGEGAYSSIENPPAHPACRCSLLFVPE